MKYKYLFTDLDDTLFKSSSLYKEGIKATWRYLRKHYKKELLLKDYKKEFLETRTELKAEFKHITIANQRAFLFMRLIEKLGIPFSANLVLKLHNIYWGTVNKTMKKFPNTDYVLKKVRQSGMGILAISDGPVIDRLEKLYYLKLSKYIDSLVASEEVIYTKPEPNSFELALKRSNCTKEEVIFLGDSFSADITGAKMFGIKSIWINPKNKRRPRGSQYVTDYEIKDIIEVLPILGIKE